MDEYLEGVVIGGDNGNGPEVLCPTCGEKICTVEEGDTLGLLVRTAQGHSEVHA